MKINKTYRDEAFAQLHGMLKPGDRVYTVLRHCSASGMSRSIDLFICLNNEPVCITWHACLLLGERRDDKHGGLKVSGCGMDMGFDLVYRLGSRMWPDGTPKPHGTRNGEPDTAGGYALKHHWL